MDFDKVITDLAKPPGAPPTTLMKFQYEEMRISYKEGSHNLHSDMNDREPGDFHIDYMKSDRLLLPCSASACEDILSIESWIHSNRRNRLGQKLVDRPVRTHTNLKLKQRLEMYEAGFLPWDIEMTVEEPVSDDDDGSPHRVSDSESESESE